MKKIIILAVALMVAFVAVPAFASVQNIKISGSIDSTYLYRASFDLGQSIDLNDAEDTNQSLLFTQTTLRVDADLTDQVSATVSLINERVWEQSPDTDRTDVDLNLAYVTLREMLYSPLTVVVGRQVFNYGNSFIVDATGTNNVAPADSGLSGFANDLTKQSALDAVRLIFDYDPLTLEVLYSKVDTGTAAASESSTTDDVDLYGINATYELGDDFNTQIEAYFFSRIDKAQNSTGANTGSKADTIYLPGLRASADVLDSLNIQAEVAWQRGNNVSSVATGTVDARDNEKREAIAAQVIANYQVPGDILPFLEEYNPALQYVYTYVSGDSNPDDRAGGGGPGSDQNSTNKDTAWDPFFEAQGGGTIYNSLFNLTNSHIHAVSLTANPIEDVTAKVTWTGIWLDKQIDNGTAAGSQFLLAQPNQDAITVNATDDTDAGYEIDIEAIYDYTEDVQIGATLGWFMPGDLFASAVTGVTGNDETASQAIIHGIVNF